MCFCVVTRQPAHFAGSTSPGGESMQSPLSHRFYAGFTCRLRLEAEAAWKVPSCTSGDASGISIAQPSLDASGASFVQPCQDAFRVSTITVGPRTWHCSLSNEDSRSAFQAAWPPEWETDGRLISHPPPPVGDNCEARRPGLAAGAEGCKAPDTPLLPFARNLKNIRFRHRASASSTQA